MSASTTGALKTLTESLGLSLSAYRDQAPANATLPYVVIHDGISIVREKHGDPSDPNRHLGATELAQVTLWQKWRNDGPAASGAAESYTLAEALYAGLDGAALTTAPKHVYGCSVDGMVRIVDTDQNLVQNPITVRLRRNL